MLTCLEGQWVEIEKDGKKYTIVNIHGHWDPKGKMDTEERLKQSRLIVDLISHIKTPVIICGDFNLLPHTESVKIIENAGMRNLIKELGLHLRGLRITNMSINLPITVL
jgi:endonuclease/exonuclease/phosphatase (EEP) superfamily protein YafD